MALDIRVELHRPRIVQHLDELVRGIQDALSQFASPTASH